MASKAFAFSHVTLTAPTRKLFDKTLQFFNVIGFRTISYTNKSTNDLQPVTVGNNNDDATKRPPLDDTSDAVSEAWLHLFTSGGGPGVTIHVYLSNDDKDREKVENMLDKIVDLNQKLARGEFDMGRQLCFSFIVKDVEMCAKGLEGLHIPYHRREGEEGHKTLYCYDAMGTLLAFTDRPLPFAKAIETGSEVILPPLSTGATAVVGQRRKRIGVLTSGGDSPGMNPAVRAVVRMALARGCIPYAIFEGWQGLVDGGDKLRRVGWEDVRGIMALGGTVIGTARCVAFRQRAGRLQAAYNMVKEGIDALVCCGGDGSLTGANLLREEWPGLVKELIETGRVTEEEAAPVREVLTIVGLVGSIDNDMCATDLTIGANTSLHRICEALDSIVSTALSHQRAFVVEVMGRHCGWLALMAAIAVGADWVFLPERPPPMTSNFETWEDEICDVLAKTKEKGNRKVVVIVAEGAIDRDLKPISGEMVKVVLEKRLGLDTRVTTLGHIQRGGAPSAFDRYLATVQGARAVDAVLEATPETPSPMIGISQNKIIDVPLMEAVALTHEVAKSVAGKDFARAMELRDPDFKATYDAYMEATLLSSKPVDESKRLRVGILNVGAPAGGMNAAVYAATRLLLNRGHTPLGINNGFSGLVEGDVKALSWVDVNGWTTKGGSELGTNRAQPRPLPNSGLEYAQRGDLEFIDAGEIAYSLQRQNIQALLIVGGFEAYTSVLTLSHARQTYPSFCIPMVHLPATISNNVPGTDYSLGSDTALNAIVEAVDRIKLSAAASRKRVFIVEVQGGNCGYLATLGGLATGASTSYIPEEGISLDRLQTDIKHLIRRYKEEDRWGIPNEGRVILRNESVSKKTYTTDVITAMVKEEGHGLFDSKAAVLGHLQQGGVPSPLDRIRAVRLATHCAEWIEANAFAAIEHSKSQTAPKLSQENLFEPQESRQLSAFQHEMIEKANGLFTKKVKSPAGHMQEVYTPQPETAVVIGIRGSEVMFTPVQQLAQDTSLASRKGTTPPWWLHLQNLTRILSKYGFTEEEPEDIGRFVTEETADGKKIRRPAGLKKGFRD